MQKKYNFIDESFKANDIRRLSLTIRSKTVDEKSKKFLTSDLELVLKCF